MRAMEGKLVFNLPEEQAEFHTAVHAYDWRGVVEDVLEEIRKMLKYGTRSFRDWQEAL